MPTGYTSTIKDDTTLAEFAMTCARNFGALIMMRDDPMDAPIPPTQEASPYYRQRVADAEHNLARISAWIDAEAQADMDRAIEADRRYLAEARAERAALLARYERMLAKVRAWTPPTSEHTGVRDFMIQQIEESIRFDCGDPAKYHTPVPRMSPGRWREKRVEEATRKLADARKALSEEEARCASRTAWVRELRASVEGL